MRAEAGPALQTPLVLRSCPFQHPRCPPGSQQPSVCPDFRGPLAEGHAPRDPHVRLLNAVSSVSTWPLLCLRSFVCHSRPSPTSLLSLALSKELINHPTLGLKWLSLRIFSGFPLSIPIARDCSSLGSVLISEPTKFLPVLSPSLHVWQTCPLSSILRFSVSVTLSEHVCYSLPILLYFVFPPLPSQIFSSVLCLLFSLALGWLLSVALISLLPPSQ